MYEPEYGLPMLWPCAKSLGFDMNAVTTRQWVQLLALEETTAAAKGRNFTMRDVQRTVPAVVSGCYNRYEL